MSSRVESLERPAQVATVAGAEQHASANTVSSGKPRTRVLYLDHTAKWGGGEVALFNLVMKLDPVRFDPAVLLFTDGVLRQKLEAAGIRTEVLPLAGGVANVRKDGLGWRTLLQASAAVAALVFVIRLTRRLRRDRPDLIHTNSLKSDVLGGIAGRLARIPVIWHVRDRIAEDYLPARAAVVFRRLAKWLPCYIIANSSATLKTLALDGGATPGSAIYSGLDANPSTRRSFVIHDGTSMPTAPSPTADHAPVSNSGPLRVALIGRISPWKGQHIFVRAAAVVHKNFPACRFAIVGAAMFGEDEYEREVRALVGRLGLADVVEFTGFRDDVPALVAGLDLLVHASTTGEPFGQVIVEGMAAGKAVVATRGGGVPEIVADGVTGILVPMNDADAMAAAMNRLLADPTLRQEMGRAGYARVIQRFTIERTAKNVEAVYDEILGRADCK